MKRFTFVTSFPVQRFSLSGEVQVSLASEKLPKDLRRVVLGRVDISDYVTLGVSDHRERRISCFALNLPSLPEIPLVYALWVLRSSE